MWIYKILFIGCTIGNTSVPQLEFVGKQESSGFTKYEIRRIVDEYVLACKTITITTQYEENGQ